MYALFQITFSVLFFMLVVGGVVVVGTVWLVFRLLEMAWVAARG